MKCNISYNLKSYIYNKLVKYKGYYPLASAIFVIYKRITMHRCRFNSCFIFSPSSTMYILVFICATSLFEKLKVILFYLSFLFYSFHVLLCFFIVRSSGLILQTSRIYSVTLTCIWLTEKEKNYIVFFCWIYFNCIYKNVSQTYSP